MNCRFLLGERIKLNFSISKSCGTKNVNPLSNAQKSTYSIFITQAVSVGELNEVKAQNPDVVTRVQKWVEQAREDLGDDNTNRVGANRREPGQLSTDIN